jgi:Uma2 family endonuclease
MTTQLSHFELNRTYTVEEFEVLTEFNGRYELIEGKLIEKMSSGEEHGWISRIILTRIDRFDPDGKLGVMWPSTSFVLSPQNTPIPDLGFLIASRVPKKRGKKAIRQIPDLVVEVWSPSDLRSKPEYETAMAKIKMYQAAGVRIIWSIDPRNHKVEVYHPDTSGPIAVLEINDELDGEDVIPGFKLKVSTLFE